MTQDDTTALTWFHQWLLLVVFYCSDSAWSSPFLVQFRMSQRQFHSLRRARGCLHPNRLINSNPSVSFYYMIWQSLPVHVQAVQPPSSPWSDLQDLQCLHRIQLGPGTCNSDSTASSAVQKLRNCGNMWKLCQSCSCGVWKHCALSTFITLTRGFTSSTSKPITPWVPWCQLCAIVHLRHLKGSNPCKLAIATLVIPSSQSLHGLFHKSIFVQEETIWPERRHEKANPLRPRPTCVVSAMLMFNTKLLRFLWCMRMEEPGSNWSWSDKEHLRAGGGGRKVV